MTALGVDTARKRFRQGPPGIWQSALAGGHDVRIGIRLTFYKDGMGNLNAWGFDKEHAFPEATFKWKSVADCTIEITYQGESRRVGYDFRVDENNYGLRELRMFEPGHAPNPSGEVGFWLSPYSLVFQELDAEDEEITVTPRSGATRRRAGITWSDYLVSAGIRGVFGFAAGVIASMVIILYTGTLRSRYHGSHEAQSVVKTLQEGNFKAMALWFGLWGIGGAVVAIVTIPEWQTPWHKSVLDDRDEPDDNRP